jgi:hypothetical protein
MYSTTHFIAKQKPSNPQIGIEVASNLVSTGHLKASWKPHHASVWCGDSRITLPAHSWCLGQQGSCTYDQLHPSAGADHNPSIIEAPMWQEYLHPNTHNISYHTSLNIAVSPLPSKNIIANHTAGGNSAPFLTTH